MQDSEVNAIVLLVHISLAFWLTGDLPAAVLMSPIALAMHLAANEKPPVIKAGEFITRPEGGWR